MTPEERDEKIVGILTKICINVLVKNLFDKNGVRVYEEVLHELNQLPVNEEEYTRCNHAHAFLHKTAIEYLQKTIDCSTCYGRGLIFIGDNEDYYVEPCECV